MKHLLAFAASALAATASLAAPPEGTPAPTIRAPDLKAEFAALGVTNAELFIYEESPDEHGRTVQIARNHNGAHVLGSEVTLFFDHNGKLVRTKGALGAKPTPKASDGDGTPVGERGNRFYDRAHGFVTERREGFVNRQGRTVTPKTPPKASRLTWTRQRLYGNSDSNFGRDEASYTAIKHWLYSTELPASCTGYFRGYDGQEMEIGRLHFNKFSFIGDQGYSPTWTLTPCSGSATTEGSTDHDHKGNILGELYKTAIYARKWANTYMDDVYDMDEEHLPVHIHIYDDMYKMASEYYHELDSSVGTSSGASCTDNSDCTVQGETCFDSLGGKECVKAAAISIGWYGEQDNLILLSYDELYHDGLSEYDYNSHALHHEFGHYVWDNYHTYGFGVCTSYNESVVLTEMFAEAFARLSLALTLDDQRNFPDFEDLMGNDNGNPGTSAGQFSDSAADDFHTKAGTVCSGSSFSGSTVEAFADAVWEMAYSVDCFGTTDCTVVGNAASADYIGWGTDENANAKEVLKLLAYAADYRDLTPTIDEFIADFLYAAQLRHGTLKKELIKDILDNHNFD